MPETIPRWPQGLLAYVADTENLGRRAKEARAKRDALLRQAHELGWTIYRLAELTGLSRAQVQRICDYSKDRGQ